MQKVKVDDNGTELAYIDSGAPLGDTYTTLVCVHGHSYHAQSFSKLFPLAQKCDLRIIALNRRDYVGSTPLSEVELGALTGEEEAREQFMKARGLEIARFLVWVVKELKIPPASEDGKTGGLALLGWSLGIITTMAFLGNTKTYPEDIVQTLNPYLRTFFIYDVPDGCLGYPQPRGYYHPLEDESIPASIKGMTAGKWLTTYYQHPVYASYSVPDPKAPRESVFPLENRFMVGLQLAVPRKVARPCTLENFTPRELKECIDPAPTVRSELPIWQLPASLLQAQKRRALLLPSDSHVETNGAATTQAFPKLKIRVLCCLSSYWIIQWETWAFEAECLQWASEGKNVRPIKFVPVEGSNHLMHWDDAEKFVKLCSDNIRS